MGTALTGSTASRSAKDTAARVTQDITNLAITAQQARAGETLSLIRRGDEEGHKQAFYPAHRRHATPAQHLHGPPPPSVGDGRQVAVGAAGGEPTTGSNSLSPVSYRAATPRWHWVKAEGHIFTTFDKALTKHRPSHGTKPHPTAPTSSMRIAGWQARRWAAWCSAGAAIAVALGLWPRLKSMVMTLGPPGAGQPTRAAGMAMVLASCDHSETLGVRRRRPLPTPVGMEIMPPAPRRRTSSQDCDPTTSLRLAWVKADAAVADIRARQADLGLDRQQPGFHDRSPARSRLRR